MEQHLSLILHQASSPHSELTCNGKMDTQNWRLGRNIHPRTQEERIVIGSSAVIVAKVRPLWRQGISCLQRFTFHLSRRIFPVHTTKMTDKNMERLIVLVIEGTLLRRLPILPFTSTCHRTRIRDRLRNEDVVLMRSCFVLPPATSSAWDSSITHFDLFLPIFTYFYLSRMLWPGNSPTFRPTDAFGEAPSCEK